MADIVGGLISELEAKGWSSTRSNAKLTFSRGEILITAQPEYVTVEFGGFSTEKLVDRFLPTMELLQFVLNQVRLFADMADDGRLVAMTRWHSAEKAIEKASWDQALKCPEALQLLEQAVDILQSKNM